MGVLMTCGHTNQGYSVSRHGEAERVPYCIICNCATPAKQIPSLEGRRARCFYYEKTTGENRWKNETHYPHLTKDICYSEADSSYDLPFFEYKPDEKFDEFYCGCHGWD